MTGTPPPPPPYGGDPGQPPPYGTPPGYEAGYGQPMYVTPVYGVPGYGGPPQAQSRPNGMAITSLVLGIIGVPFFCFVLPGILAVVFGAIGINQCSKNPAYTGKGMAVAGLVLGVVALLGFAALLVAAEAFDSNTWDISE